MVGFFFVTIYWRCYWRGWMAQVYITASVGWTTGIVMSYRLAVKNGMGEYINPKDSWNNQTRYVTAPVEEEDLKLLSSGYKLYAWAGALEIVPYLYDDSPTNRMYFRKLHTHLRGTYGPLFAFIISTLLMTFGDTHSPWYDSATVKWLRFKFKSLIGGL